ncbi:aspartate/tyrosine/aromatic aminotransferase [Glycocaulis profundi]|nr:aspartate/tyrosine/aromatic aminotransferase [Glycocaulis profundi]
MTDAFFSGLEPLPADPLLSLIGRYKADPRDGKIDLGVGVYRDEQGRTPVMKAMKAAEEILLKDQDTKAYLGPEGDAGFTEALIPIAFGAGAPQVARLQTPGGTGALRLSAELIAKARPGATIHVGTPSWPIHAPMMKTAGLKVATFRHYDPETRALDFNAMLEAIEGAKAGDVILIHGCCHNPSGADPEGDQWAQIAGAVARKGLLPLVDMAYQGLGDGLDADAAGARQVFAAVDEAMLAYSCDKNFGLYRERTGALFVKAGGRTDVIGSNLAGLARNNWSMPPDHGAAAARVILQSDALTALWREELDEMRARVNGVRAALAKAHPLLAPLASGKGMFALLPLTPEQVETMREDHAIYMAGSGRINVAGLAMAQVKTFAEAFGAVAG